MAPQDQVDMLCYDLWRLFQPLCLPVPHRCPSRGHSLVVSTTDIYTVMGDTQAGVGGRGWESMDLRALTNLYYLWVREVFQGALMLVPRLEG